MKVQTQGSVFLRREVRRALLQRTSQTQAGLPAKAMVGLIPYNQLLLNVRDQREAGSRQVLARLEDFVRQSHQREGQ